MGTPKEPPYWETEQGWDSAGNCLCCGEAGRCTCHHPKKAVRLNPKTYIVSLSAEVDDVVSRLKREGKIEYLP